MTDNKREWARPVEEVARAICEALGDDWDREGVDGLADAYTPLARAAINTLRRLGMIHEDGLKAIREEERK